MLEAIRESGMESLTSDAREAALVQCQMFLVDRVREFHNRQRIKVRYDVSLTLWQFFRDILDQAAETKREGPVAQYLVGAKLQLRFPGIKIGNESFSTADDQLGRSGDFLVNDLAIHITVSPMPAVYQKCKVNFDAGMRPLLLVPDRSVVGAKQTANTMAQGRIEVWSIEDYLSANIWELAEGSIQSRRDYLEKLLSVYNSRVDRCEIDKSMMLDVPSNLHSS